MVALTVSQVESSVRVHRPVGLEDPLKHRGLVSVCFVVQSS